MQAGKRDWSDENAAESASAVVTEMPFSRAGTGWLPPQAATTRSKGKQDTSLVDMFDLRMPGNSKPVCGRAQEPRAPPFGQSPPDAVNSVREINAGSARQERRWRASLTRRSGCAKPSSLACARPGQRYAAITPRSARAKLVR